jgi:hypothetical protein
MSRTVLGPRCRGTSATKQRLVKTEKVMCAVVTMIFWVCNPTKLSQLIAVKFCKSSINPINNPNPIYSHSRIVTVCRDEVGLMVNTSINLLTHLNRHARLCFISVISIVVPSFFLLSLPLSWGCVLIAGITQLGSIASRLHSDSSSVDHPPCLPWTLVTRPHPAVFPRTRSTALHPDISSATSYDLCYVSR